MVLGTQFDGKKAKDWQVEPRIDKDIPQMATRGLKGCQFGFKSPKMSPKCIQIWMKQYVKRLQKT